eukprot:6049637-Prymnesium_polylepis.1
MQEIALGEIDPRTQQPLDDAVAVKMDGRRQLSASLLVVGRKVVGQVLHQRNVLRAASIELRKIGLVLASAQVRVDGGKDVGNLVRTGAAEQLAGRGAQTLVWELVQPFREGHFALRSLVGRLVRPADAGRRL